VALHVEMVSKELNTVVDYKVYVKIQTLSEQKSSKDKMVRTFSQNGGKLTLQKCNLLPA
jgi:hypothetical protein